MKLTFEGNTFLDILNQIEDLLAGEKVAKAFAAEPPKPPAPSDELFADAPMVNAPKANGPVDKPVDIPVEKPAAKPKAEKPKIDKSAALAKARAAKEAKKAAKTAEVEIEPEPVEADPADAVRIRQKTIEDLQSAYANGHQQEVFELLSRFGNGAKSFRELPPEAFMPIREAIDKGALT